MKKTMLVLAAAGTLATLAACHNNAATTNTMADNSAMMGNYDAGMSNAAMDATAGAALNQANMTIANGQNMATDMMTNSHDMNMSNGM